jgi:ribokinase
MSDIVVIGSINMDLVVKTDEIPKIGETLLGQELIQIPGGKGANQGVAISKLGKKVAFIGKVGKDMFGDMLVSSLKDAGVDVSRIEKENCNSGIAVINVDKDGNNNIVVIPGANSKVDIDFLHKNIDVVENSEIVLFQLEIPLETVKAGLIKAKKSGKITVLNPAPAYDLDDEIIENTDILIPNEHELEKIAKIKVTNDHSLLKAANVLIKKGVKELIVTLGSKGVLHINRNGHKFYEAYKVKAVDTTAAGDSFIGGFLSSYVNDKDVEKSIELGQKAAALAIQKVGAQSSIPMMAEIRNFDWKAL